MIRGVRDQAARAPHQSSPRLTVTFGFGPSLFGGRFGLAALRPSALAELPRFRGDRLEPGRSGGDVCVQACADDPDVAFDAIRTLAALGRGVVAPRWLQQGFRPEAEEGSRNLLGFRDGTNNLDASDEGLMAKHVWVGEDDEPEWMRNGTYMVVRRIRVRLEHWDSVSVTQQERAIGRRKRSGAPFGRRGETDPVDPARLPPDSHVALAGPASDEERILRRSYSFVDGLDSRFAEWDAGLFFICFQRDPRRQFVPIQRRLSENDRLSEYVVHTGSAIFAIPPGVQEGGYIGQTLFESL
jgi:deferrochelatase/peroxidase EfeB